MAIGAAGSLITALGYDTTADVVADPYNHEFDDGDVWQTYDPYHFPNEVTWLLSTRVGAARLPLAGPTKIVKACKLLRSLGIFPAPDALAGMQRERAWEDQDQPG